MLRRGGCVVSVTAANVKTEVFSMEKLYLEGGAMWVNEVELLRQYGTMRGNQ